MSSPFESGIDAAVVWPNGKVYFFKGDSYLRFDIGADRVDQDPRPILGAWPGWPASWTDGIQGAVAAGTVAYFFRGSEYLRYDIAADRVSDGYPKRIADFWHGWPADWSSGIDGCVGWPGGLIYFFKGGNYIRYDLNQDKVTRGPTAIKSAWGNWPYGWGSIDRMNGGAVWPNGTAYLFCDYTYIRYSVAADTVVGDQARITDHWIGWPGYDFNVLRPGNYNIRSKTHGKYLSREAAHYVANRSSAGAAEKFTLTQSGIGWRIQDNQGAYLRLDYTFLPLAGMLPGIKPSDKVDEWSWFKIEAVDGGGHALSVTETGGDQIQYFLSSEPSGVVALKAFRRDWETFILTRTT